MENIHLGNNTALVPDEIKNYKPTIYHRMDFSKIPFNMNDFSKINKNGCWFPSENDKEHMSQSAYDDSVKEYVKFQSELIFDNVKVDYDSPDSEYSTGGSYPTEIIVEDGEKNHSIIIDDDDTLIFYNADGNSEISIRGLSKFTYADFIKICNLCGIKLKSKYIL